jgi:predicted N-acyltransferase
MSAKEGVFARFVYGRAKGSRIPGFSAVSAPKAVENGAFWDATPNRHEAQAARAESLWRAELMSRAQLEQSPAWSCAFADERKDHRYYEIVEDTIHQGFEYSYLALRDRDGVIQAIQPFFVNDQDLLSGTSPNIRRFASVIRRFWPRFLRMRTLMIGCAAGEGHLDAEDGKTRFLAANSLASAISDHARRFKAKLIVFKEFKTADRAALSCLRTTGFTRIPSMPMTRVELNCANFEDYLRNVLSRNMRSKLRRKYKESERLASLEIRVVTDPTPYIDEIYPLYLAVYEKSSLQFEKLTPEFLCKLGQKMSDKVLFFLWFHGKKIVAFNLCMVSGQSLVSEYIGLDYSVAFDLHLYYVAVRDVMKWAIVNKYRWYCSTALNYEPKFHLRHELDPLDLYVKHTSFIFNWVLRRAMPLLEPTRYDKMLQRFSNYNDLHTGPEPCAESGFANVAGIPPQG